MKKYTFIAEVSHFYTDSVKIIALSSTKEKGYLKGIMIHHEIDTPHNITLEGETFAGSEKEALSQIEKYTRLMFEF